MRQIMVACIGLGLVLAVMPAQTQNVNPAHPESVDAQHVPTADEVRSRVSNLQLQKEAKELTELCNAVRADMEGLKQGLLGKDVTERLRRIEKLSRQVREQLTR